MMLNEMKISTPSDTQIVITREFNAPRSLVWDAMTKPDLIRKWLVGPPGWEMTECAENPRVGGKFRWAWRGPDGFEMSVAGEYLEVVPLERIKRSEVFEGCPAGAGGQIGTLILRDSGRKTLMTLTLEYPTKEARDMALQSGMEHGMKVGYERLDTILAEGAIA